MSPSVGKDPLPTCTVTVCFLLEILALHLAARNIHWHRRVQMLSRKVEGLRVFSALLMLLSMFQPLQHLLALQAQVRHS